MASTTNLRKCAFPPENFTSTAIPRVSNRRLNRFFSVFGLTGFDCKHLDIQHVDSHDLQVFIMTAFYPFITFHCVFITSKYFLKYSRQSWKLLYRKGKKGVTEKNDLKLSFLIFSEFFQKGFKFIHHQIKSNITTFQ